MRSFALLSVLATTALADGSSAAPNHQSTTPANTLPYEKPGSVFRTASVPGCDAKIVRDAQPAGKMEDFNGTQTYISEAPNKQTDRVIIYLSDIFGLPLVNNKLLADSLAKAGYMVVFPDLFKGDAVPADAMGKPDFNITTWSAKHAPPAVDAIVAGTVAAVKAKYNTTHIGAVGYCFGGKYVARFLAEGKGISTGFMAHPSGLTVDELKAIVEPVSVAYADNDKSNPPQMRDQVEEIFYQSGLTWQQTMYSWVEHGFAVRANLSDSRQAFAQEGAYLQAVRWFDSWLK